MTAPLVVIGTGLAGYNLVKEFRKLDSDRKVVMITSDDGRQYSKPMLSTGFSKGKNADGLAMNDAGAMAESLQIEIRTHQTITSIDPNANAIKLGDEVIEYGDLVLAVGAEPIQLPMPGNEYVHHVNDLMDYQKFYGELQNEEGELDTSKRVVVIGAGLVGTEYAHDLASAGISVTLVAPDAQPLSRLVPDECGQALIPALENLGVNLQMGSSVIRVENSDAGLTAVLDDNREIDCQVVLSAVGLKPRTELATEAGLKINRGIEVNRLLQTSVPNIYALGDCAEVEGLNLLYVLPLMNGARALAKTLAGQSTELNYPVMPVQVKTPSLPVVTCPPSANAQGQWEVTGQTPHLKALFTDSNENLLGYALTGDCVAEKMKLNKELPAMLVPK